VRIELDQLFVCTAPGAPEAEELVRFGLRDGPPKDEDLFSKLDSTASDAKKSWISGRGCQASFNWD
jgi:hypothetical protein